MLSRRLTLAGALALVCVGIAGACADEPGGGAPVADAGASSGTVASAICPEVAPEALAPCDVPDGTTCVFGACGSPIVECARGAWRYGANPPAQPQCPALFPTPDAPCPPCWSADATCTYGSCAGDAASANTTVASCPSGTWALEYFPCPIPDAGADVQRDSEADAD